MKEPAANRPVYAWFASHVMLVDCLIAGTLWLVLVAPLISYLLDFGWPLGLAYVLLYSLLVIPLAWRRHAPTVSGVIIIVGYLIQLAVDAPLLPANMTVFGVVYALAAFGPRWLGRLAFVIALAGGAVALPRYGLISIRFDDRGGWTDFVVSWALVSAFLGISWLLGDLTRSRRLLVAELRDRAHRLEMERLQEREVAAADERARIAREMHDIVAHSLSVIITQADGGRFIARTNPVLAEETLKTVADTGRASLAEMRRLLGVLRADEGALTRPVPTLSDVDILINGLRDSGVPVEAIRVGEQRRELPAGAELAGYRVIQESFTNVLKHAGPGASVRLLRSWDARGLCIEVDDDGRGLAADETGPVGGQGIRGMGERLALYGGTLEAGPRRGGGFRVTACIPYGGN